MLLKANADHFIASVRPARPAAEWLARYSRTAIILHWTTAALVIAMIVLGQFMTEVPRGTPLRGTLFNLHKSIGLIVLALILVRLGWRLTHRPPPFPADIAPWTRKLAGATHAAFYVLLIAQPVIGYVASAFGEYGVAFFGAPLSSWGYRPALREPLIAAHHWVADLLVALICLHLLGVAWHRMGAHKRLWRRMWR